MNNCIQGCTDKAEHNFTWNTSNGVMSANFCGVCASDWWNKYRYTLAGETLTIGLVKSNKELKQVCLEYADNC